MGQAELEAALHDVAESSIDRAHSPPAALWAKTDEYVREDSGGFPIRIAGDGYLPASQLLQAVAPATEILPAGQSVQTVEALAAAYFPATQVAQVEATEDTVDTSISAK